jgi:hypothetical protein
MDFQYEQTRGIHVYTAQNTPEEGVRPDAIKDVVQWCERSLGPRGGTTWQYWVQRRQELELRDGEWQPDAHGDALHGFKLIFFDPDLAKAFAQKWGR